MLETELLRIRSLGCTYEQGLTFAKSFTTDNGGEVKTIEGEQTQLTLGDEVAVCFQPYKDINAFYWEI